jgi:hypothetical protein
VSLPRLIAMQCGHGCQNHFISQLRSLSQLLSLRAQFLHNRVHFFGFILCRGDDMSRFGIFIFFADITILPKRILISKPSGSPIFGSEYLQLETKLPLTAPKRFMPIHKNFWKSWIILPDTISPSCQNITNCSQSSK